MKVNETNNVNLAALFGKLTAQTNFTSMGEGDAFSGFLNQIKTPETSVDTKAETVKDDARVEKKEPKQKDDSYKKEVSSEKDVKEKPEEKITEDDKAEKRQETKNVVVAGFFPNMADMFQLNETVSLDGLNAEVGFGVENIADKPLSEILNGLKLETLEGQELNLDDLTLADLQEIPAVVLTNVNTGESVELSGLDLQSEIMQAAGFVQDSQPKFEIRDENGAKISMADLLKNTNVSENVEVVNLETQEKVELPVQELLNAVKQQEVPANMPQNTNQEDVLKTVFENVADVKVEEPAQIEAASKNVSLAVKDLQTKNENVVPLQDDVEIADAEQQLKDLLKEEDIAVSLNVKEEKNSYFTQKDLLKNSFALKEVADSIKAQELDAEQVSSQQTSGQAQNVKSSVQNLQINGGIVAGGKMDAEYQPVAADGVEIKAVTNNNTVNAVRAQGAEFSGLAKAETNAKAQELNTKDVYKGMSKEVVEQVKVNITKSAVRGVDKIDVHLKPEELGQIEVKMQIKDGKLQAHIISSRPETMEILQKNAQSLEQAFNDAGFQTDANSLSFSFRNENGQAQQQNENLRNFIGNMFEQESQNEVLPHEAANQDWISDKGLNIRV